MNNPNLLPFPLAFPVAKDFHPYISSSEDQTCPICLDSSPSHLFLSLCSDSSHSACLSCVLTYFTSQLNLPNGSAFPCPLGTDCGSFSTELTFYLTHIALTSPDSEYFGQEELTETVLSTLLRHTLFQMQLNGEIHSCPTADCKNRRYQPNKPIVQDFIKPKLVEALLPKRSVFQRIKCWLLGSQSSIPSEVDDVEGRLVELDLKETKYFSFKRYLLEKIGKATPVVTKVNLYKQSEDEVDLRKFKCDGCMYSSCILCKALWSKGIISHEEISCAEYKKLRILNKDEALMSEEEVWKNLNLGSMQKCPRCDEVIEKNGGCEYVYCIQCKNHFCWKCKVACDYGRCPNYKTH